MAIGADVSRRYTSRTPWITNCCGVGGPMKEPLQAEVCARKLAALASPERLRILQFLRDGPRSVTAIAAMLEQPLVNASHHLMVLRRADIIAGKRKGRFVLYHLRPSVFELSEHGDEVF